MVEPSLFGISKSEWDMINAFASWFAAAGSVAAAGVALYLANRASKPTAQVSVGHRILVGPGSVEPFPEFAVFRIVNTGDRPITITQLGWKVGLFRKRFAVQMFDQAISSKMPIELTHGQEAVWYLSLALREEPWIEFFAKGILVPNYRTALWTLRAQFFSSVGHVFEGRVEEGLLKRLRGACEKVSKVDVSQ
jgi:hypothetical protein